MKEEVDWIDVRERLPPPELDDVRLLVLCRNGFVEIASRHHVYDADDWCGERIDGDGEGNVYTATVLEVTHWAEMPKGPTAR